MRRSDLFFVALLVPIDFILLIAAGTTAYFLRFTALQEIQPVIYQIPFFIYFQYVLAVSLFSIAIFAASGLYNFGHYRIQNEVPKIFTACSTSIMLVIVFIFFIKELFTSRFIVLAAWFLSIFFIATGRLILRTVRLFLFSIGHGVTQLAFIGSDSRIASLIREINQRPWLGYRVYLHANHLTDEIKNRIAKDARLNRINEIILIDEALPSSILTNMVRFADINHLSFRYSADSIGEKNIEISTLCGLPLVYLKRTRLDGWGRILKRTFDILCGALLTVFFLPLAFVIALAIKVESPGPILYRNTRVGQDGKIFETYKFRSMYRQYCTGTTYDRDGQAEKYQKELIQNHNSRVGPVFKVLHDPRRTYVGRILERTSLDELPQFLNVLRGNMSLVGPRPHMPIEVSKYDMHHYQLFRVKPGITGIAQISGRSDLDFENEVRLDLYYIEQWSLFLDFVILLKTPYAVITRKSQV